MNTSKRSFLASLAAAAMVGAFALLILSACAAPSGGVVVITCKGKQFNPAEVTVAPGTTVRWVNDDDTAHTTTSENIFSQTPTAPVNTSTEWNSGPLNPGDTFEHKFTGSGTFPYQCMVHPYMEGTVTVQSK